MREIPNVDDLVPLYGKEAVLDGSIPVFVMQIGSAPAPNGKPVKAVKVRPLDSPKDPGKWVHAPRVKLKTSSG